jgi:2-C-methyl-D-erythritol 4-phosphate cytidylyltransferase
MVSAIIAAGGKGVRMRAGIRKQYLDLGGVPILVRTLLNMDRCAFVKKIYLVVPERDHEYCHHSILAAIHCRCPIQMVPGGRTRQESVYNGLSAVSEKTGLVLIHDGVRPFVSMELMRRCVEEAQTCGACIPGIPLKDTLKSCDRQGYIHATIPRESLWLAQTPQVFQFHLIREAHEHARSKGIESTDDASLLEMTGRPVKVIEGSPHNIKITTPEDFLFAQALLSLPEYQII